MFQEVSTKLDFTDLEAEVLQFWRDHQIFQKSVDQRKDQKRFIFLEGPPFANARPGVHHVLARAMKDAVCRYKTMTGHYVDRKAGWDTHGLPVEYQVEKDLNIKNKQDLEAYGVKNFVEKCKENVFRYEQEWRQMTERIAFWVDLDQPYITLANDYIESVWWVLRQAWEKDLLYEGHKVQPYCPRCGTTLASHEVAQGYQTVIDPSIFVKMRLKDHPNRSLLVWTTTPWTLPSNVAVAVGENFDYVCVEHNGEELILAQALLTSVFGEDQPIVKEKFTGRDLLDLKYEPLFDFAGDLGPKGYRVVAGDFVTLTDGTGLVHTAPAFGQDDYDLLLEHDLPFVQLVDPSGNFVDSVTKWKGIFVKAADPEIVQDLTDRDLMFHKTEYEHEYPFCWRCSTPLLYYARKSWFIRTTAIRDRMIEHNQQINWYPENIKNGRFGNWLENNVDWSLSRERYWGTPLPAWICESCDHREVIGSIADLKSKGQNVPDELDLHRPYIDEIKLDCEKCGSTMARVEDVIDCWFDSGVAHTAQWHYPFENADLFDQSYPADFISEGIDQTRGWFYSLLATGTLLYDKPAYKNCLCLELVNDAEGKKMSKSRGNTVDTWQILEKQGADAMRWYFYTSCPPWVARSFQIEGIDEALKKFIGTLNNVYGFFVMYANLDQIDFSNVPSISDRSITDKWLLSRLNSTIKKVRSEMENYHLTNAPRAIADFVEDLSNWYVRRSRDRFWGAESGIDKQSAYSTLYETLVAIAKLLAPFVPFIADSIYRNLVCSIEPNAEISVHLTDYPEVDHDLIDETLEDQMAFVRSVIVLGRAARNRTAIKTRQPLSDLTVGGLNADQKIAIDDLQSLILDELNVKEIKFADQLSDFAKFSAKINFRLLGPKYGKNVQAIAKAVSAIDATEIKNQLEDRGEIVIETADQNYTLSAEEIEVVSESMEGYSIEADAQKFVALATDLTDDLILEGLARELVNKIQQSRKEANFNVSDRIELSLESAAIVHEAFELHKNYVTSETLAVEVVDQPSEKSIVKTVKINGHSATIGLKIC